MAWTKTKIIILVAGLLLSAAIGTIPIWLKMPVKGIPKDWSVISGNADQWTSSGNDIKGHSTSGESLLVSSKQYQDVTLSAIASSTREASFAVRVRDANQGYLVVFVPAGNLWKPGDGFIELIKMQPDNYVTLNSYHGSVLSSLGTTAKITVNAKGPWIEVSLNDVSVIRQKDTSYAMGFTGLRIYGWGDHPCDATYSQVRFY